jgi:hypothetical protein
MINGYDESETPLTDQEISSTITEVIIGDTDSVWFKNKF